MRPKRSNAESIAFWAPSNVSRSAVTEWERSSGCRDVVNQFSSIHKRDGTTFCGNSFGNAAPDPLSRSGDDHDPVVEPAGEESRAHDATLCRASVMARCIVDLACSLCWTIRSRAVARSFCSNARTIRE